MVLIPLITFLGPFIDLEIEGEINPIILGLGTNMHIEAKAITPSRFSIKVPEYMYTNYPSINAIWHSIMGAGKYLVIEFGPGNINLDLDTINTGIFVYSDFNFKLKRYDPILSENFTILEGDGGHFELTWTTLEKLSIVPFNLDFIINLKFNGDFKLFNNFFKFNGSGEGTFNVEAQGPAAGGLYVSLQIDWEGTHYFTVLDRFRLAVYHEAHIDFDFGQDPDTGETVMETNEMTLQIQQNEEFLVMNQNEEIIYDSSNQPLGNQVPITLNQFIQDMFDSEFYFWVWVLGKWRPQIPGPDLEGSATLLTRKIGENLFYVGTNTITLPEGTNTINFTAWYKPGKNNVGPYDFVFNYGDGGTQTISATASQDVIKISPEMHSYSVPGSYVATVTVIDYGYDSDETTSDTATINVIEKYLSIVGGGFNIDFEKISEYLGTDEKIHKSFEVVNKANSSYPPDVYTIYWNMKLNLKELNEIFGTNDWDFDKTSGVLLPGERQTVNYSFTPNLEKKGDYKSDNTSVYNVNKTEESYGMSFIISYGIVQLYPSVTAASGLLTNPPTLLVTKGQVKEFSNLFWVSSKRWETLNWEIYNKTYSDIDDITITPESGVINPGDPLTPISIIVDASDDDFSGGYLIIKIRRVGDAADNDTIVINIIVMDPLSGEGITWITPDGNEWNSWKYEGRSHDNNLAQWSASSYRRLHGGWTNDPLILTLDDPISCCGFRINAKAGDNLDQLEVKLYNDNTSQFTKIFSASQWGNYNWTEWDFGTSKTVNKVEIRQHLSSGTFAGHWAVIREFDFKEET